MDVQVIQSVWRDIMYAQRLGMLKSKDMLDEINLGLATLQNFIRPYARLNYTDINISAESLVADTLNSLYGWNLVNANTIRRNFPCIDLLDTERGVGVQVTSEKGVDKINQTLNCTARHELNLKRLIVFTLTPRLKNYNVNSRALDFDHARDVLDFDSVILKAGQSSFDELSRLHVELKSEFLFDQGIWRRFG
ncbi:SMEK domain-containing protein [Pseudomonas qingdaonensis]|nr:SMEK domain-containing protein [Pseudomonas qingdaonensis]